MSAKPTRRSIPERISVWLSAGVLALTVYVASYPLVFEWSQQSGFGRFIYPVVQAAYYPLYVWVREPESLGNAAYLKYANWVFYHLNEPEFGNAESNSHLGWPATADFTATRLRDIIKFLGDQRGWPIELDSTVDGDLEVTIKSSGPLRDVLNQILEPLGLIAWPADGRIAIGTPAAIERIRAADRANHPFPAAGYVLLGLIGASAMSLLILQRRSQQPESHNLPEKGRAYCSGGLTFSVLAGL